MLHGSNTENVDGQTAGERAETEGEHFDRLAREKGYAQWGRDTAASRRRLQRRAHLLSAYLNGSKQVFELGCGYGSLSEFVKWSVYYAADISKDQLLLLKQKSPETPAILQADVMRLPFPDGAFDAVFGNGILHHVDMAAVSREIYRVLRSGGKFWFAEPNRYNPELVLAEHCAFLRRRLGQSGSEIPVDRFKVIKSFTNVGFSDVSAIPFDWLHPGIPAPLIRLMERLGDILEALPGIKELSGDICIKGSKPVVWPE